MRKFKIYLAGKMSGLTFEQMNTWRIEVKNHIKDYGLEDAIHTENPCDFYNFEIDPSTFSDKECKNFDLWLVENCDLVLVNLDFPDSIGTAIELELANRWSKPVIAFGTRKDVHCWMELNVTKHCTTMEDALEHILKFYFINHV